MTGPPARRPAVAVLDYGLGNLRSVARAVDRSGGRAVVTSDPAVVDAANGLILPGVGAFGMCMRGIREAGLEGAIRGFVASSRPVLAVCLGMQVLFEAGEEGKEEGLGLLGGVVRRLPAGVKVPHMGWNEVRWVADHPLAQAVPSGTSFYFVHSYAAPADVPSAVGVSEHGSAFCAAAGAGSVWGVQFHPEKSGAAGLAVYAAFVQEASARGSRGGASGGSGPRGRDARSARAGRLG